MARLTRTDWEGIRQEYIADQISNRELARRYGISDTMIRKKAKQEQWVKNLSEKVRAKISERLVRDVCKIPKHTLKPPVPEGEPATDEEIADAAAERAANIVSSHRSKAQTACEVVEQLMAELKAIEQKEDSLSSRAGVLKSLTDSLKTLVAIERQAYSIDANVSDHASVTPVFSNMLERSARIQSLLALARIRCEGD